MDPNLSQALHLLNGETVHQKIIEGKVVERLLESDYSPAEIIDELYFRCLARKPTNEERANLMAEIDGQENKRQALEDIFWAILNSREFVFNH